MQQYILKYPIDGKIYSANNPKEAAKKAFLDLCKYNKYDQSRVTILENNSKKEFNFLGMTNNKLDQYNKVLKAKNPIQIGGSNMISDKEFYDKVSEISGNINLSMNELTKILKLKYEPKDDDIILLAKEGINKLNTINENVNIIKNNINKSNKMPKYIKSNKMPIYINKKEMPKHIRSNEIPVDTSNKKMPQYINSNEMPLDIESNQIEPNEMPLDMESTEMPVENPDEVIDTSEDKKEKTNKCIIM